MARDCGVAETDLEWQAMFHVCEEEKRMDFFLGISTAEGRKTFLTNLVRLKNLN